MTRLELEISNRGVKIKDLAEMLGRSNYRMGQKIKENKFNIEEAKILIKYFGIPFDKLFDII